jgi:membrane associated rhomboid family serine protease
MNQHFPQPTPDPDSHRGQPVFNIAGVVVVLIVLNGLIHFVRTILLDPHTDNLLVQHLAFVPLRYSGAFDALWLTSALTYGFVHGSMVHLGFNMIWLAVFGSPLAARIGASAFVAFYLGGVVAAALTHALIHPDSASLLVGASGGVSAVTGAAARFAFQVGKEEGVRAFRGPLFGVVTALSIPQVLAFCGVWFVANALSGANLFSVTDGANIAWEAHIGGFVYGFLLVGLFVRQPRSGGR